jgi:hypothetical protein
VTAGLRFHESYKDHRLLPSFSSPSSHLQITSNTSLPRNLYIFHSPYYFFSSHFPKGKLAIMVFGWGTFLKPRRDGLAQDPDDMALQRSRLIC